MNYLVRVLATGLVLSGCGSNDSSTDRPGATSKPEASLSRFQEKAIARDPVAGPSTSTNGNLVALQIIEQTGPQKQFVITNAGTADLEDVRLTAFPPPLSTNTLWVEHGYSSTASLEINSLAPVAIRWTDLRSKKGQPLIESRCSIGALLVNGTVDGKTIGVMFLRNEDSWTVAPQGLRWAAIATRGLQCGESEDPLGLNVQFLTAQGVGIMLLIKNREPSPVDEIRIRLTSRGDEFLKEVNLLQPGGETVIAAADIKSIKGHPWSGSELPDSIQISGKKGGLWSGNVLEPTADKTR